MVQRTSITDLKKVIESRGHLLLNFTPGRVDPNTVPQASSIKVQCKKCGHIWSPRLQTYLERQGINGGCRHCFNNNIQNRELYPDSPFSPRLDVLNRSTRRAGKAVLRKTHLNGPYGFIQNREQLIDFLKTNPNPHNHYVLELVLRDTEFPKRRSELPTGEYSYHHVIPLHAKGSPDNWNLIYLTKQEHDITHRLRYEVYQDRKDLLATYATGSDVKIYSTPASSTENSLEDEGEEAIHQRISRKKVLLARRTPETLQAISEGMIWIHQKTGTQFVIKPNSVETIQNIKELLIENLPTFACACSKAKAQVNDDDRKRMLSNESSSNNYIREHINTVFKLEDSQTVLRKPRSSVYGFIVQSLKSFQNPS